MFNQRPKRARNNFLDEIGFGNKPEINPEAKLDSGNFAGSINMFNEPNLNFNFDKQKKVILTIFPIC